MTEKHFQRLPANDEQTGTFTYESYLKHLQSRVARTHAELVGFIDAKALHAIGNLYDSQEMKDHYQIGFTIGKMYLKKKEQGA